MDLITKLYQLSHRLLHLGEDGSPVYAHVFSALNVEVLQLSDKIISVRSENPESEAKLCVALLMGYCATIFDDGSKDKKKQVVLDRALVVLDQLQPSFLKCQLLLLCYGEVYEKELIDEARRIIVSWSSRELTSGEYEMLEFYNDLMQNPNSL